MSIGRGYESYNTLVQGDGNLVVYGDGNKIWNTGTSGSSEIKYFLKMQDDGNLVLYNDSSAWLWCSYLGKNQYPSRTQSQLNDIEYLLNGQRIVSTNGLFEAIQNDEGVLAVRCKNAEGLLIDWESNPDRNGFGEFATTVQPDGNLVIYRYGVAGWKTQTCGAPGNSFSLKMQDDGNLVLYNGDGLWIWASHQGKNPGIFGSQSPIINVNSWDLVDSGKHLDYDCNSIYMNEVETGAAIWNNYRSGVIRKDTLYNFNDVTISDEPDVNSNTVAITSRYGTIVIYEKNMQRLEPSYQLSVITHELGHALGLGHNTYFDIMFYRLVGSTALSENDKASYDTAYDRY